MTARNLKKTQYVERLVIICLLILLAGLCCASLVEAAKLPEYKIPFNRNLLIEAIFLASIFSCLVLPMFAASRFSFGYTVALSLFAMMVGFLWINTFTRLPYDHRLARWSAVLSFLAFLVPTLVRVPSPPHRLILSQRAIDKLLLGIELLAFITLLAASRYNFRLVSLEHIYDFRQDIDFPGPIRYAIGISLSALLPFAFAIHLERHQLKRAALALLMMFAFYPITLSKLALFAPAMLLWLLTLISIFEARVAAIMSLLLPLAAGFILSHLPDTLQFGLVETFFKLVNVRMFATQSNALDVYNSFFSSHPFTYFCQISVLKPFVACPYDEPISVVMQNTYSMGYMNSSLFSTEGVASVGPWLAPFSALVCGAVFTLANHSSAGLPPRFILLSSGLMPQIVTNVPLSTSLLTHGLAVLVVLWWAMPRPAGSFGTNAAACKEQV